MQPAGWLARLFIMREVLYMGGVQESSYLVVN